MYVVLGGFCASDSPQDLTLEQDAEGFPAPVQVQPRILPWAALVSVDADSDWIAPPLAETAPRLCEVAVLWGPWVPFALWAVAMHLDFWSSAECYPRARLQPMGQDSGHLPRKPSPAWHTCAGNVCRGLPLPSLPAAGVTTGLCWGGWGV